MRHYLKVARATSCTAHAIAYPDPIASLNSHVLSAWARPSFRSAISAGRDGLHPVLTSCAVEQVRCNRPASEEIGDVIGRVAYFQIAPLSKGIVTPMQKEQYGVPA